MASTKLRHDPVKHDYDFTCRKTVHVKMWTETHVAFKTKATEMKLSMQEIMNVFVEQLVDNDSRLLAILKDYKKYKRTRETESLIGKVDTQEIYDRISDNSPFGDKKK